MDQHPARVMLCVGVLLLLMPMTAKGAEESPHVGRKTGEQWGNQRLKMEFLWCPPGSFTMGSPQDEPERVDDEAQVPVTLTKGFWLGKYEVTQDQWKGVMQTEPWVGKMRVRIAPDSPACWLNWDQAHLYCQELTRQERASGALPSDWEYVLPTEAQWEYACRAGTTTKYSFGDDDELMEYAWYGEEERRPQHMHARAVGQKKPNPWGFYDLHGNVVEWCRDWYRPVYTGGTDPYVGTEYNNRVTLRGGEWRIERKWSRSACRQNLLPSGIAATIGFRVSLQQCEEARTASGPTIKLAVVSFENRGKVLAYERIGPALSGLIAGRLSQTAALDVLERQSAQGLTSEATLAQTGIAKGNSADQPKEFADYVLSGVCEVVGKQVRVAAKLTKPGIPRPVAEWKHQRPIDQLFELENELSRDILAALKVGDEARTPPKALPGDSPMVAILPFVNHSPSARLDDMQLGFAELLQAGLGEIPGIRLVERGQIDKILKEQKLSIAGMIDPKTAIQVGKLAGAHRLLTGSFLELGDQISLQARMINTRTGAVVAASKVSGTRGKFGELTDDLIRQITGQLEVAVPDDKAEAGVSTRIGRSLESALHAASADRFEREGNLPQAIDALRQVLLLEPHSTMAHINLIRVLSAARDYEEIVKVGEHGLLYPQEYARCMQKFNLLLPLAHAYSQTQRYDALDQLYEKYVDDCGLHRIYFAETIANVRIRQKRFPEATRMMEEIAEKDVANRGVLRSEALRSLFRFHVYHSTSVVGIPIKDHQDAARKAIGVYERVLDAAKDGDPADLAAWAQVLIPAAVNLQTISDDNQRVAVLTPDQITACQRREYEVFSQVPGMGAEYLYKMGVSLEGSGAWEDAVRAYQQFLEETLDVSTDSIQPFFGNNGWMLFDWIDKRIEAQYRVASIQAKRLREEDHARESFRTLVNDFGVAHFAGPDTFVEMHELNLTPEIPARSALVWGGSTSNLVGWRKILAAENLRMHAVRKDRLTLTDIAPYEVVIINHSSNFPFMPEEVLALRNYVACGGSVLIVVSPVWQAAAPLLHNSLLTLFDMQAEAASIPAAKSTEIRPHPVTQGISSFTAYHSVGLQVPDIASLIKSGDKTILAAAEYRQGRVVVAAVGAWYTPEILLVPEIIQSVRKPVPQRPIPEDVVRYRGSEPEPPVLRQSLRWLAESRRWEPKVAEWRKEWLAALKAAQEAQACLLPAKSRLRESAELPQLFDRLVANAPHRELKEDALWAAGETCLQDGYFLQFHSGDWNRVINGVPAQGDESAARRSQQILPRKHLQERTSGRGSDHFTLPIEPRPFDRLVKDYATNPLVGHAKLRLATVNRWKLESSRQRLWNVENPDDLWTRLKPLEAVSVTKGTYPDAWIRLERGLLHFQHGDYENALAVFEGVADEMPVSAEKEVAMLNVVQCQLLLQKNAEALRRISQLETLPDISFHARYSRYYAHSDWAVHFLSVGMANTQHFTQQFKAKIETLKQHDEFQKWFAERKPFPPRKSR